MQSLRREKVHALILQRWDVGEADRRLLLFTRSYGLLKVMAKGVRKIPSRRGGHVEPLTHVVALLSGHGGHYYVAAVEPYDDYYALRDSEAALESGQFMLSVIKNMFGEGDAQPILFDALHQALSALAALPIRKQQVLEVAILFLALQQAGLLPDLSACSVCGERRPQEAVVLQAQRGGWACLSCHGSFAGTVHSLSPQLFKAVRWLSSHPQRAVQLSVSEEQAGIVTAAVRSYVLEAQPVLSQPAV